VIFYRRCEIKLIAGNSKQEAEKALEIKLHSVRKNKIAQVCIDYRALRKFSIELFNLQYSFSFAYIDVHLPEKFQKHHRLPKKMGKSPIKQSK